MNAPILPNPPLTPADMVQESWVHSDIYTSKDIFELEMENIFHKTWMFVGHESELPNPGDYRVTTLGRQSAIFVRGNDNQVRVLMNRCRHRGMAVCVEDAGNTKNFTCWYHGWVYDTTGACRDVPGVEAYGSSFDKADFALTPAPRIDSYRGFVFASLSPNGVSLDEHLGHVKKYLDITVEASPLGEIDVSAGVQRTKYKGNWKYIGMDGYHPYYTHNVILQQWKRKNAGLGEIMPKHDPLSDEAGNTLDLGNGHVMLDYHPGKYREIDNYLKTLKTKSGGEEYIASMYDAYGEEKARDLLAWAGDPHAGIYPNLQLINVQIRIIQPIAPDETEVLMFPMLLKGVPDGINEWRLRQHESFYGPSSSGSPDDAEIFERNQLGLSASVNPWLFLGRGLERQETDENGIIKGKASDEVTQRGQLRAWKKMMQGA